MLDERERATWNQIHIISETLHNLSPSSLQFTIWAFVFLDEEIFFKRKY